MQCILTHFPQEVANWEYTYIDNYILNIIKNVLFNYHRYFGIISFECMMNGLVGDVDFKECKKALNAAFYQKI